MPIWTYSNPDNASPIDKLTDITPDTFKNTPNDPAFKKITKTEQNHIKNTHYHAESAPNHRVFT